MSVWRVTRSFAERVGRPRVEQIAEATSPAVEAFASHRSQTQPLLDGPCPVVQRPVVHTRASVTFRATGYEFSMWMGALRAPDPSPLAGARSW